MKASTSDQRFELHQDFRLLYSIMNGQDFTSPIRRLDGLFNATPLFGVIQVYDLELLSYFVSIDLILQWIDRPEFILSSLPDSLDFWTESYGPFCKFNIINL